MKKLVEYGSVIYASLIFIGYLDYVTYYNAFGIDIAEYLTTGELLFSFLRLTIPLILVGAIYLLGFIRGLEPVDETGRTETPGLPLLLWYKWHAKGRPKAKLSFRTVVTSAQWSLRGVVGLVAFVLFYCLPVILAIVVVFNIEVTGKTWGWYLLLSSAWILMLVSATAHPDLGLTRQKAKVARIVGIGVMVLLVTVTHNRVTGTQIRAGQPPKGAIAMLFADTLVTSDTLAYIGRTERAVFFFDRSDSSAMIVPSGLVQRLILRDIVYVSDSTTSR